MPAPPTASRSSVARLLVLAVALLAWTGCGQSDSETGDSDGPAYSVGDAIADSTIAMVVSSSYGTDTLTTNRYQQQLNFLEQRTRPSDRANGSLHREAIRQFVQFHVLRGKATEGSDPVNISEEQIDAQLASLRQRFQNQQQGSEQTLEDFISSQGITMDSLRQSLAAQLRQQAEQQKIQQMQQEMAQSAPEPTTADVQSYSQENRRIGAQHILLRLEEGAPPAAEDSVRQRAQALIEQAKDPSTDFAELARQHSEGPSASQGGDLGMFGRGQMVEPFSEAAFALSDSGDVYDEPVRTQFGYHVIRLTNAGEPMDTSQARRQLTQERQREAVEEELNKLMQEATVRINPDVVEADIS
jgi:peptidyl-prolyl cis-trans isomerase C